MSHQDTNRSPRTGWQPAQADAPLRAAAVGDAALGVGSARPSHPPTSTSVGHFVWCRVIVGASRGCREGLLLRSDAIRRRRIDPGPLPAARPFSAGHVIPLAICFFRHAPTRHRFRRVEPAQKSSSWSAHLSIEASGRSDAGSDTEFGGNQERNPTAETDQICSSTF